MFFLSQSKTFNIYFHRRTLSMAYFTCSLPYFWIDSSLLVTMRLFLLFAFNAGIIISCTQPVTKQPEINYGSNNGKYIDIRNTKIYYEEYGRGVPLILLHPGLGSIENFKEIIPLFADHYRVIIPDAPGHGRSYHSDSTSRQLLADYSSVFIDELKLDSVYVFGWSTGGITALSLAAKRPDKIKKVISGGSNTRLDGITDEGRELQQAYTIEAVEEDKEWLANYKHLNPEPDKWKSFFKDNVGMWSDSISVTEDELKSIPAPVLLVRGDRDLIKIEHSVEIYRALKKGQLCIYPGADHNMPSQQAPLLAEIAMQFFNE